MMTNFAMNRQKLERPVELNQTAEQNTVGAAGAWVPEGAKATGATLPKQGSVTPASEGAAGAQDYTKMMQDAQQAQMDARAEAMDMQMKQYVNQKNQIARDTRDNRAQIYKDARVSAIGNNEALAAQGLAGGLYDAHKSGYSETSRIGQDMNLRTNLAQAENAQLQAQQELENAILQLQSQNRMEDAQLLRDNAATLIQMMMEQEQFDRQMDLAYAQLAAQGGGSGSSGGSYSSGGSSGGSATDFSGYSYPVYEESAQKPAGNTQTVKRKVQTEPQLVGTYGNDQAGGIIRDALNSYKDAGKVKQYTK